MTAPVAGVQITAENGRPAVLDRMQRTEVSGVQQMAELLDELLTVGADNIGHLIGWPLAHGSVWARPDR